MTTDNILQTVGSAQENLTKVEASLFDVVKLQLHPNIEGFNSPQTFGVYKGTGGAPLGVMGDQFEPMQPKEFLESIVTTSHESGADLKLETLKFNEYSSGSHIEFEVSLPPIEFTNAKKVNDVTEMKLVFTTSYNGSKSNKISLFTKRLVCLNGMMAWGKNAESVLTAKNTAGGKKKILTYTNEVMKVMAGSEDYRNKIVALNNIQVTQKQVNEYISKLLGYDITDAEIMNPKRDRILDKINQSIALEFDRTGDTMFGLLQGITHYTNHVANEGGKYTNDEYIRFHTGYKINETAQRLAFAELN